MLVALLEELQQTQARILKLQDDIAAERVAALRSLPARYGFADVETFAEAIRRATRDHEAALKRTAAPRPAPAPAGLARTHSEKQAEHGTAHPKASAALPTGTSLEDPTNFGQMPDPAVLDQGGVDQPTFRHRLLNAISFANQVLHTSRVPAPVWREWREFERKASERLRALTA